MKTLSKLSLAALVATTACSSAYQTVQAGHGSPRETTRKDSAMFSMTIACPDSTGWTHDRIDNVRKYLERVGGGLYVYTPAVDTTKIPPGPHRLRYDCRVAKRTP